jgi:hypothetical protein
VTEELDDLYSSLILRRTFGKHESEGKNPKLFLSKIMCKRDNLEYLGVYGRLMFGNEMGGSGLDLPGLG